MSNFSYYCMECGSPTTEFKPKFCPSCGKPFFSDSYGSPIDKKRTFQKIKTPLPSEIEDDDDDSILDDDDNSSPIEIDDAATAFDLEDAERKRVTLKDLEHQEKMGAVRDPLKKVSKKQALEEFKREASASSRVNKQ